MKHWIAWPVLSTSVLISLLTTWLSSQSKPNPKIKFMKEKKRKMISGINCCGLIKLVLHYWANNSFTETKQQTQCLVNNIFQAFFFKIYDIISTIFTCHTLNGTCIDMKGPWQTDKWEIFISEILWNVLFLSRWNFTRRWQCAPCQHTASLTHSEPSSRSPQRSAALGPPRLLWHTDYCYISQQPLIQSSSHNQYTTPQKHNTEIEQGKNVLNLGIR